MMLTKILDLFRTKSGLARPERWLKETLGSVETYAGVEISAENALTVSAVAACVRLLSESVASLPLHVFKRAEHGKVKADSHGLYSVIHDAPNDYQTSYTWRSQLMSSVLLHGNAYSLIERDSSRTVRALWPLDPTGITVIANSDGVYYESWSGGKKQTYDFGDVLHIKGPSMNGITGLSVISMARQGLGLAMAQDQHGASLFKNGARPGVILRYPGALTDTARARLKDSFDAVFKGALSTGKTIVLEGGMEVERVGFSSDDAQFLQNRQFSVQEIARWFRVPPHLIGDPSRLAYASSETEMNAFLVHSLRPWLVNLEQEMTAKLLPDRTQYFVEFDANGIARGDQASRYEAYSQGLAAGFLTVADVRAWENLPFVPGTDQLLRPANMLPAPEVSSGQQAA